MAKICLATVTTKEFIPATLVMIFSFLKHNIWFKGDIVIIHDELETEFRQTLEICFPDVRFLQVSIEIKEGMRPLLSLRPDLLPFIPRFYALEFFRLRGYEKVLFYDSDILFRGSVQGLLAMDAKLICCGEGLYYMNGCRQRTSLIDLHGKDCNQKGVLRDTFSSGFLLIEQSLLTDENYQGLLALLNAERWSQLQVRMSDQAVFNIYFSGQQTLISSDYNYLLRHRANIYAKEGLGFIKAKVLHYNGPIKPWNANQMLSATKRDLGLIQAMNFWNEAYAEVLQVLHFRSQVKQIQSIEGTK